MRDRVARKILMRVPPNRFIMYSGSVHTYELTRLVSLCCMWLLAAHTQCNILSMPFTNLQECSWRHHLPNCWWPQACVFVQKCCNVLYTQFATRWPQWWWMHYLVDFQWSWGSSFLSAHYQCSLNRLLRWNTWFATSNLTSWIHPFHFSYYLNKLSVNKI
jgi:hypothetical protein